MIQRSLPPFKPATHDDADEATDAIRLPPVLVAAPTIKVPPEMQALSKAEFAARRRKQYPGASVPGQDPFRIEDGAPNYARLQYEEDRRNEKVNALGSFADVLEATGDRAAAELLRRHLQNTSGSTYKDPLIEAMDKSANGGRR